MMPRLNGQRCPFCKRRLRFRHSPTEGRREVDLGAANAHLARARRPGGRGGLRVRRGKSGLHGEKAADNFRPGRPEGQRHRKQTASRSRAARVKGWGKSPPRTWRQGRHGKPRLEQDQIGTSRGTGFVLFRRAHRPRCPGRSREPISNGRSRGMIVAVSCFGKGGTKPGLQAVWHLYRLSAFRLLGACGQGASPADQRWFCTSLGRVPDYPRISAF